ncbi:hypothetical protein GJW-30_1_00616 [Variibacter gotjawalensis]|uniref:Uncharacterized protein n=1 Tax=Variibacter gotjawalensis TaxID=1333996 RepID=A0A0S3PQ82_9BRAD|nr:type II toxin-antitoxin system ParD family antitoxin [Variibacter gotjawalensis]NIK48401.1 antitoxin ParD1/3/4 [Variibacter gotjawalensis]RZS50268.1 antitoxin ParD1/3/4 [Variibacter gotjawalensis]BAT58101.1 hypothetical protein GJW-30_1_00616 [Variibacter gotjawalensis]
MRTLTISLTPQQVKRLQKAVDGGAYASNSEIVRDALRLWEHREELRTLETKRLKQAYQEGKASGIAPGNIDTLLIELNAKRRGRG